MPDALESRQLLALVWQAEGPSLVTNGGSSVPAPLNQVIGAINAVASDPSNPNVVYVGAVNGGIWKSTNALSTNPTWTPQTDGLPSLSISSLSFDPTDPTHQTLVAGVGNYSSLSNMGGERIGVLRTNDGGQDWEVLGELLPGVPEAVRAVAERGQVIVAAADDPGGLFVSGDGGKTFSAAKLGDQTIGKTYDLVGDPNNTQILYASMRSGVIRSDDGGATWSAVQSLGQTGYFAAAPTSTVAGQTMSTVVVALVDPLGQILTGSNAHVTLSLGANPGGGTLSGTTTVTAVGGIARFTNLSINAPGSGYTLTATTDDPTIAPVTSAPLNIVGHAEAADGLLFQIQPPLEVLSNPDKTQPTALPTVTVRVVDQFGVTTDSSALVTLASTDSDNPLGGTTTVAAVHGVATFTGLSVAKAGSLQLSASGPDLQDVQSTEFTVTSSPGPAAAFAINRIKLSVSKTPDPTTGTDPVYAGVIVNKQLAGVFRSAAQGENWAAMDVPVTQDQGKTVGLIQGQGEDNFSIAADPTNPFVVFVGGDTHAEGGLPTAFGAQRFTARIFRGDASQPAATRWTPIVNYFAGPATSPPTPIESSSLGSPIVITAPNHGLITGNGVIVTGISPQPIIAPVTVLDKNRFSLNGTVGGGGSGPPGGFFQIIQSSGTAPHADSRNMAFNANNDLIEVDDGGIYLRSQPNNPLGAWSSIEGNLQVTEFHSIAFDPVTKTIIGGAQDNGTMLQLSTDGLSWREVLGADGGKVDVAPDGTRYYSEQELGNFSRQVAGDNPVITDLLVDGTTGKDGKPQTIEDYEKARGKKVAFYSAIAADTAPNAGLRLVIGSNFVYESFNGGDTFNVLTPDSPGSSTAIAYGATSNPGVLYVGTSSEATPLLSRPNDGAPLAVNSAYVEAGGKPVGGIAIDQSNALSVYVIDTEGTVWHTVTGGTVWTKITGNLEGTLRSVAYAPASGSRPGILVVGTDRGVFYSLSTSETNWSPLQTGTQSSGLPNAPVLDLRYYGANDLLLAGTLGRGAWEIPNFAANFGAGAPPTIANVPNQVINANSADRTITVPITVADPDTPSSSLTVKASSKAPTLIPPANVVISGTGANRTATITAAPGVVGKDEITLVVSDGTLDSFTTFDVFVTPVGSGLTVTPIPDLEIEGEDSSEPVPFAVVTTQPAGQVHVVSVTSSNPDLIPPILGENILVEDDGVSANAVDKTLTVVPVDGADGSATITLTLTDGVETTTVTFDVDVHSEGDGRDIKPIKDVSVVADGTQYQIPIRLSGPPDPEGGDTITAESSDQTVLADSQLSVVQTGSGNYVLLINSAPGRVGTTEITLTVGTEEFQGGSQTFRLTLNPAPAATAAQVVASPNPATAAQPFTVTAVVLPAPGSGPPTGSVTFLIDGVPQQPAVPIQVVNGVAQATFTGLAPAAGTHLIGAHYNGNAQFAGSDAQQTTLTVNPPAVVHLTVADVMPVVMGTRLVGLDIRFAGDPSRASAQTVANYRVVVGGRPIGVVSAVFDPSTGVVHLTLAGRVVPRGVVQLTVRSSPGASGVKDVSGLPLVGDNGIAGQDYRAAFLLGSRVAFVDGEGRSGVLRLSRGGLIDLRQYANGDIRSVRLINAGPGRSVLSGRLRSLARGPVVIPELVGAAGVINRLRPGEFVVVSSRAMV